MAPIKQVRTASSPPIELSTSNSPDSSRNRPGPCKSPSRKKRNANILNGNSKDPKTPAGSADADFDVFSLFSDKKQVKTASTPPVEQFLLSTSNSPDSSRNLPGSSKSPSRKKRNANILIGDSKDPKTPAGSANADFDIFSLFSDKKSAAKRTTAKKTRRKSATASTSSPAVDLEELLKVDIPLTLHKKSFIEGVFDKFMEADPYASVRRYLPVDEDEQPEKPLTLFSPIKENPRTFSAPIIRSRTRKALYSPTDENLLTEHNRTDNYDLRAVSAAREELMLGSSTPLFRKHLDPSAYSPCSSGNAIFRLNESTWSCGNEPIACSPEPSCGTPLTRDTFKTPCAPLTRSRTISGEPLSGVKALFLDKSINDGNNTPISVTSRLLGNDNTPVRSDAFNVNTPDRLKSSILLGITCYVEVKFNKEDLSECIRKEVAFHGAKVVKSISKKVTHVIFKEGKISTYMKAKEFNIPVVSLLWLDACKTVGGLVDPAQYAPTDDEKYQKGIPIEEAKRRERFLRRGQAFLDRLNGILPPKPPRTRSKKNPGVSATEGKRKNKAVNAGTMRILKDTTNKGPKKLDFNNAESSPCRDKKSTDGDSDYVSDVDSDDTTRRDQKRRKSAPADLGEGGQQKLTKFFNKKSAAQKDDNLLRTPPKSSNHSSQRDLLKVLTGGFVTTEDKKRRKLFDPNESMSFSQILPATPVELSPYIKVTPASKKSRSRTTSSKRTKRVKEEKRFLPARKSLAPLMEQEEQDEIHNLSSSRNSLSYFVLEKKTKAPVKCSPRIAFTSISKEDIAKYKEIVKKLGSFEFDSAVTKRTTHLLTSAPARRTVNLLKALARGCWILDVEWIIHSESNGKWMSEEPFEMKSFSEAVTACRLEKQAFGKEFSLDLFSGAGHVFIDSKVEPPRPDLAELLKLCGGKVVHVSTSADVIISRTPASEPCPGVSIVSPLWILDSITQNKSLPSGQYKI